VSRDRYPICHTDRTLHDVYQATQRKHDLGYHLQVKRECNWDREVKTIADLKQFLDAYETIQLLQSRNAFSGGRTITPLTPCKESRLNTST